MANKRISMVIEEEIRRLKSLSHSQRKVASILGIHRNTVKKYWNSFERDSDEVWPEWCSELDWKYIKNEIETRRTPKKILFEELSLGHQLPTYSSFFRILAKKIPRTSKTSITIRIERSPGQSLEVDYSGGSIDILCASTGEIISTELFVGTMSYSGKIYAEFTESQRLEDWISSHVRMFRFYGGVPSYVISDNLKSGVTKADKYDPRINRTYNDMAKHYGVAIDPADKYSPQHKPNVERAVGILQRDFFPRVRNRTFTSINEINRSLWDYLKEKNAEVMKERGASREAFFEKEKALLKSLPKDDYELCYWKKVKVHPDCHFQLQYCYYSVPHHYVGKEIDLKYSSKMVYAYYEAELIACHSLRKGRGHRVTIESHYPEKKIVQMQMSLQALQKKAKLQGENTFLFIQRLLVEAKFPLKNLRKAQAIMQLSSAHNKEAMEYASEMALTMERHNYRFFKSCLQNYRPKKLNENADRAPIRQLELICLQGGNYE